ncbi:MAG: hypothetical protein RIS45_674, partial [Planctomycetota bacterium]
GECFHGGYDGVCGSVSTPMLLMSASQRVVLVIGSLDPNLPAAGRARTRVRCAPDLNGDGFVGSADLAALLTAWGSFGQNAADLTGDQQVDAQDVASMLAGWGPCQ